MSGKTKILVLHMKEVIYTGIFLFLGLIFLVLLAIMFLPKRAQVDSSAITTEETEGTAMGQESSMGEYVPGIYTAALEVSGNSLEMQVIIEQNGITDVSFTHLDEAVETMFPLFTPVLESIAKQLKSGVSLEDVTYEDSQKYTAGILIHTLETVLETAAR
ncbi:MAG: hypothetical protein J6A45_02855 [Lachnospiraceae bacterium]|nr:hypothetical protein [Lachnospiraceae bacterium]